MQKKRYVFLFLSFVLFAVNAATALDRQPNADYHARREALAKKADAGAVVLFAPEEGRDSVYAFRQEDNFYYLTGITVPGAALMIANVAEARGEVPARAYTEILFLPPRNLRMEKFTAADNIS